MSMRRRERAGLAALVLLLAAVGAAAAHPLAPALLDIEELTPGQATVIWKQSRLQVPGSHLTPLLPARCAASGFTVSGADPRALAERWRIDCGRRSLAGERLGVGGLAAAQVNALLRVRLADGRTVQRVLDDTDADLVIPRQPSRADLGRDYLRLGVTHVLGGADHLLFVIGLLLLLPASPALLKAVTAFTAGHSVTLALAVLGVVRLPSAPVEALIAASVFALAVELTRAPDTRSLLRRAPWIMALSFGMLHGLGFAAALREIGLPSGEVPLALLAFNLGIEAGQLAVVGTVLAARSLAPLALPRRLAWMPAYAIGCTAAYWCIQRGVVAFY